MGSAVGWHGRVFSHSVILRLTTREQWNHCPGIENPADLGSRGVAATTIKTSRLWWQGPEWLNRSQEWPSIKIESTSESKAEIKKSCSANTLLTVEKSAEGVARIIDMNTYSSCEKLFRVTAYVYRFVTNLKLKVEKPKNLLLGNLTAREVEGAENAWVKETQSCLTEQKNFNSLKKTLACTWMGMERFDAEVEFLRRAWNIRHET